jgi:hypothetical protein
VKKTVNLVLSLTLALLCVRAQANDTSVAVSSGSKEKSPAKTSVGESNVNKKTTASKPGERNKPFKMASVVIKAARIVPGRLQSEKEARKS